MDSLESCIPPGFRFHPTDEELVGYYLNKKVASQKIDLDVIRDIDLYRIEPWDLQERCRIGHEEQSEWYFFSHKDKKYPTGTRTNRATLAGFWKATGRDKAVHAKNKLIGMRKTLVFYKGRAPNGLKTDWIMHEYRLESEENAPPQEEGWVVCRAFKKRTNSQPRNVLADTWDSTYCCFNDPLQQYLYNRQQQTLPMLPKDPFCKQETELEAALALLRSNNSFIHRLPQLESPSLPLALNKPISPLISITSENEETEDQVRVTDWRALDKFVASQLSHEESSSGLPELHVDVHDSDMAALLQLQEGEDQEERKMEGLLGSSDGICVFDK